MNSPKLLELCRIEGYEATEEGVMELLEENSIDSVVPGICSRVGCNYSCEVEPDQDQGWCEECQAGTVVSCLKLSGLL